jgi:hypothetical protein
MVITGTEMLEWLLDGGIAIQFPSRKLTRVKTQRRKGAKAQRRKGAKIKLAVLKAYYFFAPLREIFRCLWTDTIFGC